MTKGREKKGNRKKKKKNIRTYMRLEIQELWAVLLTKTRTTLLGYMLAKYTLCMEQ